MGYTTDIELLVNMCARLEGEPIIDHAIHVKTNFRILENCYRLSCFERFELMLRLCKQPMRVADSRRMHFCDDTVEVTYNASTLFDANLFTNLIITPKCAIEPWKQYRLAYTYTKTPFHIVDDPSAIDTMCDFSINIVPLHLLSNVSQLINAKKVHVGRVLTDALESMRCVPAQLNMLYSYLWLLSNVRTDAILNGDHMLLKRKGFLRRLVIDLSTKFPGDVVSKFVHTVPHSTEHAVQPMEYSINGTRGTRDVCVMSADRAFKLMIKNYANTLREVDSTLYTMSQRSSDPRRTMSLNQAKCKLEKHIAHKKERFQEQLQCGICLETISHRTMLKCCWNSFCFACINAWVDIKPICPLCKRASKADSQVVICSEKSESRLSSDNLLYDNLIILLNKVSSETVVIYVDNHTHVSQIIQEFVVHPNRVKVIRHAALFFHAEQCDHLLFLSTPSRETKDYLMRTCTPHCVWSVSC